MLNTSFRSELASCPTIDDEGVFCSTVHADNAMALEDIDAFLVELRVLQAELAESVTPHAPILLPYMGHFLRVP